MVQINLVLSSFVIGLLTGTVVAHPAASGHHHARNEPSDLSARAQYVKLSRRTLADCSESLKARGHEEASKARRTAVIAKHRRALELAKRENTSPANATTIANVNHNATRQGITMDSSEADIFSFTSTLSNSCILVPEVTQGPYYVSGEYIRTDGDVRETELGVDLYIDVQIIDIATCEPVVDAYVDWWHANATGVYSGVNAQGNGNYNDKANINKTFLRGLIRTDDMGVAAVTDKFGGHYDGRATHTHMAVHINGTVLDNGTYTAGEITHIGQIFWDESLITEVNLNEPYASNTDEIVENVDDNVFQQPLVTSPRFFPPRSSNIANRGQ
ncbi:Intradiol ring-cleavage dioxygenase [Tricladium varicosporioides]|nr:Intradiol ring-cleavage dioxygenase [Hymenoscyphus varicosporioides]